MAFGARAAVNSQLRGIGELTDLSIDTEHKKLRGRLELDGEAEPIEVVISKYRLQQGAGGLRLHVEKASASRPWMTEALRRFVVGQSFPIPAAVERYAKMLM